MEPRNILKLLVHFAEREYQEKRPKSIKVYRIKSKSLLTRGMLPSLQIKQIGPIAFLVIANYGENFRIYSFSRQGTLIAGENIDVNPKVIKQIEKSTKLEFQLPRKEPVYYPKDVSAKFQEILHRHLNRINTLLGIKISSPYAIIVHKDIGKSRLASEMKSISNFRVLFQKRNNSLEIPALNTESIIHYHQHSMSYQEAFDLFVVSDIFTQYLETIIQLPHLTPGSPKQILNHIPLVLAHVYFNFKYASPIKDQFTVESAKFQGKNFLKLFEKFIEYQFEKIPKYKISVLLKSVHKILSIISFYQIKLSIDELYYLYGELDDFILSISLPNPPNSFISFPKIATFFHNVFKNAYDFQNEGTKINTLQEDQPSFQEELNFLIKTFGMNAVLPVNKYREATFTNFLSSMDSCLPNPKINEKIGKLNLYISDVIRHYISNEIFDIELKYNIQNDVITLTVTIFNKSDYVFKNFAYKINWKPIGSLDLLQGSNIVEESELDKKVVSQLTLKVKDKKACIISCVLSLQHPLFPSNKINMTKKIGTILIQN